MKIFLSIPEVKGDVTVAAYANQIECSSFRFELGQPQDAATGQPTGKRRYQPILVTKPWDRSSPAFGQAIVSATVYPKATFSFVAETPTFGAKHLQVVLTNVTVREVGQSGAEGGALLPVDEVRFEFQTIEVTFSPPGVPPKVVSDSDALP